jgi:hypothetical protein
VIDGRDISANADFSGHSGGTETEFCKQTDEIRYLVSIESALWVGELGIGE